MSSSTRYAIVAALAIGCLASLAVSGRDGSPQPAPPAPGGFRLAGLFVGPTASADAATIACLCDSLAEVIEYDGEQPEPRLKTGAAFDDLRISARELRLRGESIGARQPRARDAIEKFLTDRLGTDGGPVSPEKRSAWVASFRDIARAADDAAR